MSVTLLEAIELYTWNGQSVKCLLYLNFFLSQQDVAI